MDGITSKIKVRRQDYVDDSDVPPDDDNQSGDGLSQPVIPIISPTPSQTDDVVNLEDAFANLFKSSTSGTGEEELLRIASRYSLQLSAHQIRLLLFLEQKAWHMADSEKFPQTSKRLRNFVQRYLELKQHNQSDIFVMKALEFISLRKFLNENSLKVNIEK